MKHEDKQKVKPLTGNGNPPPKDPPKTPTPEPTEPAFTTMDDGTGEGDEDTGNGNPPPKG